MFVENVEELQVAVDAGDVGTARRDESRAQGDYDFFRALDTGNAVNASAIDGLITDVVPGESFGGLHAVERDLWTGGDAKGDAASLEAQALVAQFLLSRPSLDPEAIGLVGVDDLDWVQTMAIPERLEQFSHLDGVDIEAGIEAADQAFEAIQAVGHDAVRGLTTPVTRRFDVLNEIVAASGTLSQMSDSEIPTATLRDLYQAIGAAANDLALLSAGLVPFGVKGVPS